MKSLGSILRVVVLTAFVIALWAIAKYGFVKPDVLPATAPVTAFSAERAYTTLGRVLGPEKPHPVSSAENAAVRARIQAEFAALGVKTSTYRAFACNPWRGFAIIPCATVTDIVAEIVPGAGKAIVLLAHYDSVPAGPGASDDESGAATVLEVTRALRARGTKSLHPVIAVITDGEEAGLLGAQAFLENKALKARVGAVVNVEARGTRGRSLLFQTSAGDSKLIDLYAKAVPFYATSSLYAEIYRFLPNDTDLTLFIHAGFPSFNFAFSENVADYHTPLDRRENLSKLTLQEQGDNMLGVASALETTDYTALAGANDVYLDLFGAVLPRMPTSWALPLAIVAFLLLLGAAVRLGGTLASGREWMLALVAPVALMAACGLTGLALHFAAQAISGQPDPSFAYPIALREGLAFGVLACALFVGRMVEPRAATMAAWLWFGLFAVVTAALVPGFSPYFLFPALIAAIGALAVLVLPGALRGWIADGAFAVAMFLALVIWIGLTATGETLMGLKLHPLFTVPAALGVMTMLPLLNARGMSRSAWLLCLVVAVAGALVATVIAGVQPAFSRTMAQRLSIRYVEDASTKKAQWSLDAGAPLPAPLRAAADFAKDPAPLLPVGPFPTTYNAPAGTAHFAPPHAEIVSDATAGGIRKLTVALHGSPDTDAMALIVPKAAALAALVVNGEHMDAPKTFSGDTLVACASRDCRDETVTMTLRAHGAFALLFAEQRYGLPQAGANLVAARPKQAIPSQSGDLTFLAGTLHIEAK
jgi:peptidase M28-like protein